MRKVRFWHHSVSLICSAANRGRSTVNYSQSLAFDHPYVSCNDHCDWWLLQEIFIIFRSSRTQMFFKTGVIRNFTIFTGKHLCWSLFLIKNNFISTLSQKRLQHMWFLWKLWNFYEHLFLWNTSVDCLCQFDKELLNDGHLLIFSSLSKTKYVGWFLLKWFVDLVRVCYLHIISRNHSSTLSLINLQKTKTCPKKALQQRLFVLLLRFWQCRHASVQYPVCILMACKETGGVFIK